MLKGEIDNYFLRAKIDMSSSISCLRDTILGKINKTPHQRTGKNHIFYPTFDFACPIIDYL
jgi:glutamyl/glutaminyl-tRNA synthetase